MDNNLHEYTEYYMKFYYKYLLNVNNRQFRNHNKQYDIRLKLYKDKVQIRKYSANSWVDYKEDKTNSEERLIKLYEELKIKDSYNLSKYNEIIKKLKESKKNKVKKSCSSSSELKEIRKDNLTRTRNTLIDYASMNVERFKSFVTLTFAENIIDVTYANRCLNTYLTQVRRYCKKHDMELFYLGVPEFQKRGAVHYHIMMNIEAGSFLLPVQKGKENMYDVRYWNHGFTSVLDFNKTDEGFNPVLYMIKYLYKDIDDRLFGHKKVLKSHNLVKPDVVKLEENSTVYQTAIAYMEEKGYLDVPVSIYDYKPKDIEEDKFKKPFIQVEYKLEKKEDYEMLKEIIGNELPF